MTQCVNRTGCETPNDCRERGYCRSPNNAPQPESAAQDNVAGQAACPQQKENNYRLSGENLAAQSDGRMLPAPATPSTPSEKDGEAPHCPAAFINAIAEEGTKAEAVEWLQKTWNELCQCQRERNDALAAQSAMPRSVAANRLRDLANAFDPVEGAPTAQEWGLIRSTIYAALSSGRERNGE